MVFMPDTGAVARVHTRGGESMTIGGASVRVCPLSNQFSGRPGRHAPPAPRVSASPRGGDGHRRFGSTACPRPWASDDRPPNTRLGPSRPGWATRGHFLSSHRERKPNVRPFTRSRKGGPRRRDTEEPRASVGAVSGYRRDGRRGPPPSAFSHPTVMHFYPGRRCIFSPALTSLD
jgi:hypothetical protein